MSPVTISDINYGAVLMLAEEELVFLCQVDMLFASFSFFPAV